MGVSVLRFRFENLKPFCTKTIKKYDIKHTQRTIFTLATKRSLLEDADCVGSIRFAVFAVFAGEFYKWNVQIMTSGKKDRYKFIVWN